MKDHQFQDHFSGSPSMFSSVGTTPERPSSLSEPASSCQSPFFSNDSPSFSSTSKGKGDPMMVKKKKFDQRKVKSYVYRIREHVKMGPKFSETVKGKLSVGAKIIQKGGREKMFRHIFSVSEGEQLLKASQCYLSTTAGPIAGILFISTQKVAFCSERPITLTSCSGSLVRAPYKVIIPVKSIKSANESENVEKPTQKYIAIVTEDNFEFLVYGICTL